MHQAPREGAAELSGGERIPRRCRALRSVDLSRLSDPALLASGPNKRRGAGWDFVDVCIDDHSRVAFSEIKLDEPAAVREPDED
ncbi:hypothetical protein BSZ21_05970 [Bradyrhizobium canariense]|uniref:hypothetical protein n=1 Tax=Bradyrhizobium canariense TaxID=255045 RepID=UPI000A195D62|nr:hypothetical protein [Bradyrhizobium canariense]OSI73896.1 hypothetical protein BSZ21_05970 [Bradyrhizobium canariense]